MEINCWMQELQSHLLQAFGDRLLFFGLQGSRRRGEARPDSDIDIVVILDTLSVADMDVYRNALDGMPEAELACGFICGREELLHWPRYDLVSLVLDTQAFYGTLAALLPPLEDTDARQFIRISAANLYHAACHMYLYEHPALDAVRGLYKAVFYILRVKVQLEQGRYIDKKTALGAYLTGQDLEIYNNAHQLEQEMKNMDLKLHFQLLCDWCAALLKY